MRGAGESIGDCVDALKVRTVKPRDPIHKRPRVVACDESMGVLIEMRNWHEVKNVATHRSIWYDAWKDGNQIVKWVPWEALPMLIPQLPADTIIVTIDDLSLVKMLDEIYANDWFRNVNCPDDFDEFQFALSEEIREIDFRADAPRITTTQHRVVMAGFKRKGEKKKGHWYRIVAAPKFLAASTLKDRQWNLLDLLHFGQVSANFTRDAGVPLMASAGATAGKLLRLPRYYPEPRRRVPRATNEAARPSLRGHPYKLFIEPMESVTAVEFDQRSAHPHAAATTPLPSANQLFAGYAFTDNRDEEYKPQRYLWRGNRKFDREIARPGLFYLKLYGPTRHSPFCPNEWQREGPFTDFVTSNEVAWLRELNIGIDGIVARWTSRDADDGIERYARDALAAGEARTGFERAIVKAIFLAGLGVLGARPHPLKVLRGHEIKGGEEYEIPTRKGALIVHRKEMRSSYQIAIANLIQRSMIERECAKRSWQLAARLDAEGWRVVCVYADSVFATPPNAQLQLASLPEPWREKMTHTNLQFKSATTYVSDQACKTPGVRRFGGHERAIMRDRWQSGLHPSVKSV